MGYHLKKDILKKMWKLTSVFEIMDVDNGFFTVKCELFIDREKNVLDDSWVLFDHYLTVPRWTLDFASPLIKVKKTLVWIRFPRLKLLYYDKIVLGLTFVVSAPIKVVTNTLNI